MSEDTPNHTLKKRIMIKKMIKKQQMNVHNSKSYIKKKINDLKMDLKKQENEREQLQIIYMSIRSRNIP
jgi:hypothetical protein